MPHARFEAGRSQVLHVGPVGAVEPETVAPSRWQTSASPLMPAPPIAMKWSFRVPPVGHRQEASTISAAMRSAASGRAREREAADMSRRRSGSVKSSPTVRASAAGVERLVLDHERRARVGHPGGVRVLVVRVAYG